MNLGLNLDFNYIIKNLDSFIQSDILFTYIPYDDLCNLLDYVKFEPNQLILFLNRVSVHYDWHELMHLLKKIKLSDVKLKNIEFREIQNKIYEIIDIPILFYLQKNGFEDKEFQKFNTSNNKKIIIDEFPTTKLSIDPYINTTTTEQKVSNFIKLYIAGFSKEARTHYQSLDKNKCLTDIIAAGNYDVFKFIVEKLNILQDISDSFRGELLRKVAASGNLRFIELLRDSYLQSTDLKVYLRMFSDLGYTHVIRYFFLTAPNFLNAVKKLALDGYGLFSTYLRSNEYEIDITSSEDIRLPVYMKTEENSNLYYTNKEDAKFKITALCYMKNYNLIKNSLIICDPLDLLKFYVSTYSYDILKCIFEAFDCFTSIFSLHDVDQLLMNVFIGGCKEIVDLFLRHGFDFYLKNPKMVKIFDSCTESLNLSVMTSILVNYKIPLEVCRRYGNSLLQILNKIHAFRSGYFGEYASEIDVDCYLGESDQTYPAEKDLQLGKAAHDDDEWNFLLYALVGRFSDFKSLRSDNKFNPKFQKFEIVTPTDINVIMIACFTGDTQFVEFVAENSPELVNKGNYKGVTPLMVACKYGNLYVVKKLCDKGAIIELKNKAGHNALDYCIAAGNIAILNELISSNYSLSWNMDFCVAHGHYLSLKSALSFKSTNLTECASYKDACNDPIRRKLFEFLKLI